MADDNHDLTGGWLMDAYSKAFKPLSDPWNAPPDTDFSQFFAKPMGSMAPVSEDPFERAAERARRAVRERRAQGRATLYPEAIASRAITGIPEAVIDAATLPRDAWRGKVDPMSDEGIQRSVNFGLTVGMMNAPFAGATERAGAAGVGGGRLPPRQPPENLPAAFKEPETPSMPLLPTKEEAEATLRSKLPATAEAQLPAMTAEPESPLAAALQQPVSRRSFLQTAAKVPVVASRVKNIGDVLETLGKEPAAQPVAAALPKLNVIEKKGIFGYDDINEITDRIADERGLYDDLKERYKDEYNYDIDAGKDLTTGEHNRHHQNAYSYDEMDMTEGLDEEAQAELRQKHVMHEDELEHQPILPGADDSLRETLIQHNPEPDLALNHRIEQLKAERNSIIDEAKERHGSYLRSDFWKDKSPDLLEKLERIDNELYRGPQSLSAKKDNEVFYGSHDEPNVLMSYKTTDRNIEGANTLHGEEFKSDWHDALKKYVSVDEIKRMGQQHLDEARAIRKELLKREGVTDPSRNFITHNEMWDRHPDLQARLNKIDDEYYSRSTVRGLNPQGVPDAPYKDNWHEVAFDHFLSKAIKEGKDAVSWTKSESIPKPSTDPADYKIQPEKQWQHGWGNPGPSKYWSVAFEGEVRSVPKAQFPNSADAIQHVMDDRLSNWQKQAIDQRTGAPIQHIAGSPKLAETHEKLVDYANKIGQKFGSKVETKNLTVEHEIGRHGDEIDLKNIPVHFMRITPQMRGPRGTTLREDTSPEAPLALATSRLPTKEEAEATLKSKLPAKAEAQLPTTTEESPLAAALQQPVSRRSFLQTAAKVPVVASRVKNIGDVLETLGKEPAAQPVAAALPKLNVIEKKGMFGYDDIDNLAQDKALKDESRVRIKDEQGNYLDDAIEMEEQEPYLEDAEAELRKKHVMHEDELEHQPILPGADDSLRETLIQHHPNPYLTKRSLSDVEADISKYHEKVKADPDWGRTREGISQWNDLAFEHEALEANKLNEPVPGSENKFYGSHDEPNVLMSYKTTDRNIEGANTLHGEEFKSDWHDQGKQRGYGASQETGKGLELNWSKGRVQLQVPVPDAPYKDNWHEVAFDHFLSKAIKEGKDAVSWTAPEISPTIDQRTGASIQHIAGSSKLAETHEKLVDYANKVGQKFGSKVETKQLETGETTPSHLERRLQVRSEHPDWYNDLLPKLQNKKQAEAAEKALKSKVNVPVHFMHITPQMRGPRGGGGGGTVLREDTSPVAPLIAGTYHSALDRHVAEHPTQSAPANQWIATLENAPIKREELADNGVIDWLKAQSNRPITRQALTEKIREGTPKIKVVEKSGLGWREEELDEAATNNANETAARRMREEYPNMKDTDPSYYDHYEDIFEEEFYLEHFIMRQEAGTARYHPKEEGSEHLSLPGGDENYRETLLKLPDPSWYYEGRTDAPSQAAQQQMYRSDHWDEPNVIAHYRANDRNISDPGAARLLGGWTVEPNNNRARSEHSYVVVDKPGGRDVVGGGSSPEEAIANFTDKQPTLAMLVGATPATAKSLHLEEVQSDWHQEGRKRGYKDESLRQSLNDKIMNGEQLTAEEHNLITNYDTAVPDAPFKKSWPELTLKHALKKAVDEGYDAISWTPGGVQVKRYPGLDKQVDNINYDATSKELKGMNGGTEVYNKKVEPQDLWKHMEPRLLQELMKPERARTLKESLEGHIFHSLSNNDPIMGNNPWMMRIGGSGMRGFYDKIMVDTANGLGKRYGAKVEQRNLNASGNEPQPVHFMRITPQMREAVGSRSFSLYEDTSPVAPLAPAASRRHPLISTAPPEAQELFDKHIAPHMDEHEFARRYLSGMYDTDMKVDTFNSSTQGKALQIEGNLISSPDIEARFGVPVGTQLGYMQRHMYLEAGTAYHELLAIGKPYQGMGIGRRMLADQVGVYGDLGFNKVKLLANKSAGSYSWAKHGFLPSELEWGRLAKQLKRYITQGRIPDLDPPTRQMLMYMLEEKDPKTLWAISDMTDNPTGAKNGELGKRVLANTSNTMKAWDGVLNLNDVDQMERFHDYVGKIKP